MQKCRITVCTPETNPVCQLNFTKSLRIIFKKARGRWVCLGAAEKVPGQPVLCTGSHAVGRGLPSQRTPERCSGWGLVPSHGPQRVTLRGTSCQPTQGPACGSGDRRSGSRGCMGLGARPRDILTPGAPSPWVPSLLGPLPGTVQGGHESPASPCQTGPPWLQ